MNKKIERPDAGTFLGVLYIIGLVLAGIGLIIVAAIFLGLGAIVGNISGLLGIGNGLFEFIKLLIFFVIGIYAVNGIFKGDKNSIYILAAFTALSTFQSLYHFSIFGLAINGLFAWLEYTCYIDPFYNQNNHSSLKK